MLSAPWTDRGGRFSALRLLAFAWITLPGVALLILALTDGLGPEPLEQATHDTGRMALRLLGATLAVTPLGRILDWPKLFALRRMLGLGALAWAVAHALLYAGDQNWVPWRIASEIVLRFYLLIGFLALSGLVVLGWTSTDAWMKRLGRGWKKLHRLVFPIAALAVLHAFIQGKSDVSQAVVMSGLLLWLVAWRALPAARQRHLPTLAALAVGAALAAAGLEWAWYAGTTNLPAGRILAANLDVAFGPRPAVLAGMILLGAVAVAAARRLAGARRAA